MLVNVLVQSDLSAPANGYLQVAIDSTLPVGDLITKFCESKHIEESSQYCLLNSQNHVLDGKKPISHYGLQSGDKVIFCSVNEKPQQFQSWGLIAILAVVFSVIGFIVCFGIHLGLVTVPDSYALVLDAGSTHTAVILYRWPGNKINNTGIVVQESSRNIKDGIAKLTNASKVSSYLRKYVDEIRAEIPHESLDYAEIFFGATAGMRVLKMENEKLADEILTETRKTLRDTGLKFTESKAEILTGSVEGASGWLTVNYLNNNLESRDETWGALDLGGASTQISFEIDDGQVLPSKNESLLAYFQVYGRKVKVFSKSFLCYGVVEAMARYRAHLILESASNPSGRNITSPCEPAGYSMNAIPAESVLNKPCSPRPRLSNETVTGNFSFVGSSNWEACQSKMRYVLSEKFCEDYNLQECISIKEIPLGFQQLHFMGFSSFGYTDQTIGLGSNGTLKNYFNAIKSICTKSTEELYTDFFQDLDPSKPSPQHVHVPQLCFRASYMYTLLAEVYQFNDEEKWSNLRFGTKIKEKDLGWALGFMVNETQSIAAAPSRYGMNTLVFILLLLLFSIFFFISTGFVIHALKSRKSLDRTYSSLGLSA